VDEKYIKGVAKITERINDVVFSRIPKKVSEDTVRRKLIAYECGSGGLVCEGRPDKKVFQIAQNSLDSLSDPCDIAGLENIAKHCSMSVRWVKYKKKIRWVKYKKKNDKKFPIYTLFGRDYSTQRSLDNYLKDYWQKSGNWKPTKQQRKKIGITWTDPT